MFPRHAAAPAVRGRRRSRIIAVACGLTTLLAGRPLTAHAAPQAGRPPTFNHDIAPVLFEHCATCHHAGGPGPFALVTYEEARARARQLLAAVTSRTMPPWKAAGPPLEFERDRRLSDAQIALVREWVEAGAPRGNPTDLPQMPSWPDGWQLGPPDMVVKLERPYPLAAGGPDRLRNFVVPVPIPRTRFVRAWEFRTSGSGAVHHATLMIDRGTGARRLDADDPESGYEGLIPFTAQSPEGYFLGWTPGQRAQQSSPGMAWRIDPGNDLILMLHLRPTHRPESVDASVALYFSDRPPVRAPVMIRLNRQDLDIPAGAKSYVAEDSYTLPVDVELHAIQPHAHFLARTVVGTAVLPDGTTRDLLRIPAWDFHWQDVYHYRRPMPLPAGTRLSMTFTYDNSDANRANPSFPPARVIWGQRATDEMGDLWLQVVPSREADHARLVADLRRKVLPQNIDGYQKMLEAEPANPSLHDDLALLGMEAGNVTLAIAEFREAARLRPGDAPRRYNVGNVLLSAGKADEALAEFLAALRLDANHGLAHQGLGLALAAAGRIDEGSAELEVAARLLPGSSEVRYNLGVLLQQRGRLDAALEAFERAASIDAAHADARYAAALIREARGEYARAVALLEQALTVRSLWSQAQSELAWILATAPAAAIRRPDEAIRLARAAVDRDAGNARAMDVLGAALASAGRYGEAADQARAALARLPAGAEPQRREAIAARLSLYERQQPFRMDLAPIP
ncbi:MAG TPA: tetratricopeptide repeat protein [Vicinamibacterales bacterium]|nr:tetratricopeptide repeat protein [Vicinamibacterales bacterium]